MRLGDDRYLGSGELNAMPPAMPRTGSVGSRYQLGDKLGTGGMAEVFSATMLGIEGFARRVAIKRMLAGLSQLPAFAQMFITEARIASRLAHPNVVSVLDFNRDADDRLYLVMEHVDGKDLASLLATGPIAPSLAIFVTIELLRGLGHAHAVTHPPIDPSLDPSTGTCGVVHRDVSPQNVLLGYEGAVKVSDFGIAKARAANAGVWSETVRGKPSYMSPEQIEGKVLDGRTDLYAVGVMLWEMLARRALFAGTTNEILSQAMFRQIAPPSRVCAGVASDVEAVAMKLLERDREARYATADAAIAALLDCRDVPRDGRGELVQVLAARFPRGGAHAPHGVAAARLRPHGPRPPRTITAAPQAIDPVVGAGGAGFAFMLPRRRGRARRWLLAALALSGLTLGLVGLVGANRRGGSAGPEPASATRGELARVVPPAVAPVEPSRQRPPWAAGLPATRSVLAGDPPRLDPAPGAARPPAAIELARTAANTHPDLAGSAPAAAARPTDPASPRSLLVGARRAARTGELAIIVKPWAMISLDGKPIGQTPFRAQVPAGRYRVRLVNDDLGRQDAATVIVEPDQSTTLERAW